MLAEALAERGARVVSGGTDNHLMLVDVTPLGVTGKEAEHLLDEIGITVNKNAIPFDPLPPNTSSGIRVGTPATTTRGFGPDEMREIAPHHHRRDRAARRSAPPSARLRRARSARSAAASRSRACPTDDAGVTPRVDVDAPARRPLPLIIVAAFLARRGRSSLAADAARPAGRQRCGSSTTPTQRRVNDAPVPRGGGVAVASPSSSSAAC